MRRLLLALALGVFCLIGPVPTATAVECSDYVSDCEGLPARVVVAGPKTVTVGSRAPFAIKVATYGSVRYSGTITVTYRHRSGTSLEKRRSYPGEPINVRGPRLTLRGRWTVTVFFERDSTSLTASTVRTLRVTRK